MYWCHILGLVFGGIILMYALLELHYFLRMFICVIYARYCRKKCHVLDTTTVTGVCLTTDVDTLLYHMNNARYLRELDFARVDFYERSGLYRAIVNAGGAVVQGAATIRYRRFVKPFSKFKITSKIVYWDSKSVFMEHRFITPSDQFVRAVALCRQRLIGCDADDVMSGLLRQPLAQLAHNTGTSPPVTQQNNTKSEQSIKMENGDLEAQLDNNIGANTNANTDINTNNAQPIQPGQIITDKFKLPMPLEVARWIESNDISSANLRSGC